MEMEMGTVPISIYELLKIEWKWMEIGTVPISTKGMRIIMDKKEIIANFIAQAG